MRKIAMAKLSLAAAFAGALLVSLPMLPAEEPKKDSAKKEEIQCCPMDPKAAAALDRVKALSGTWAANAPGQPPMTLVFHPTAGRTAVQEVMFPGSDHEMINMYTADGDKIS